MFTYKLLYWETGRDLVSIEGYGKTKIEAFEKAKHQYFATRGISQEQVLAKRYCFPPDFIAGECYIRDK